MGTIGTDTIGFGTATSLILIICSSTFSAFYLEDVYLLITNSALFSPWEIKVILVELLSGTTITDSTVLFGFYWDNTATTDPVYG